MTRRPRLLSGLTAALTVAGCALAALYPSAHADVLIGGQSYPDPLVLHDGARVTGVPAWEGLRRAELLSAFRAQVYGQTLPRPRESFSVQTASLPTLTRKNIAITVTGPYGSGEIPLRVFLPRDRKPLGTFLLLDHRGTVTDAADQTDEYFPVQRIVAAGYAAAALDAKAVAPDNARTYRSGVLDLFYPAEEPLPADAGRTISTWAWAASRAMDYLETERDLDPARVAVIGHSRAGKTALWAGAQDTRFAAVIANDSGALGAKLARRSAGESISAITGTFPHWFPPALASYGSRVDELPVDQHELLALIAPRRLYIASASRDTTADPQGEFLSLNAARPVFAMYGSDDSAVPSVWPPRVDTPYRGESLSYHLRQGDHGLLAADWEMYLQPSVFSAADRQRPFSGVPAQPAEQRLEAENYDLGGEAISFHDIASAKPGMLTFRPADRVGVDRTPDGGRYVGWVRRGEWLEYTVSLPAGTYDISTRVAAGGTSGQARLRLDFAAPGSGRTTLGTVTIARGAGWQAWRTETVRGVRVSGGGVLRVLALDDQVNLDWLQFTRR